MQLSDLELRVLGALVEKERTTPDAYPLSSQSLLTACNQRTSRDPVTDYHLQEVQEAAFRLKERGFVATVQEISDRVPKHRHQLWRTLDVTELELALLAVLILRGPQTPGELRGRIERYRVPNDPASVEATLQGLAKRSSPLVVNIGRSPGQSQDRWRHTLGSDETRLRPRVRTSAEHAHGAEPAFGRDAANGPARARLGAASEPQVGWADAAERLAERAVELERRVAELERRVAELEAMLGVEPE